jgi:hypothetical protein
MEKRAIHHTHKDTSPSDSLLVYRLKICGGITLSA